MSVMTSRPVLRWVVPGGVIAAVLGAGVLTTALRASADTRLRPGDLLGSGTVGTGCLLEVKDSTLGRYLEPGDEVVLRVDRLGALRTPIVARAEVRR